MLAACHSAVVDSDQQGPDDALRAKGLTRTGSLYLLRDDASLPEWLRLVRGAQKTLNANLKQRASIDGNIKTADTSIAAWDREVKSLTEKQEKVKNNAIQYNELKLGRS
jgi:hypothetical protein